MENRKIWEEKLKGRDALGKTECPFCKKEEIPIIQEFENWYFIQNKYPYKGAKKHTLLVPKRHIEHTKNLQNEELLELAKIEAYIEKYYKRENYFSFIRQTNGGKSICHLHYHYISGVLYSNTLSTILQNQHP
ncbi:HIT domain-containing protein [Candidatus Gracilibacteria bacterium]|nr:HIT domain-containing protein [Candidatus Gracilibacteria bacterium]